MITRSVWHYGGMVTVACLIIFLPLLVYRIRQGWRNRSSIPAVAATVLAVVLYLSGLSGLEWVWMALPPGVRAAQEAVRPVLTGACLQAFVVSVSSRTSLARLHRDTRVVAAAAAVVATVVAALNVAAHPCAGVDLYTCSSTPVRDHHLLLAYLVGSIYLVVVLAHSAWLGFRRFTGTPAGWGLAILAAGCVVELIPIIHGGIYRQFSAVSYTHALWLEGVPVVLGIVLFFAGFIYPPVATRIQARRFLRELAPLWSVVSAQYPGLSPPRHTSRNSLPDKAFDQIAYIQDAMTLTAQHRQTPPMATDPPSRLDEHAEAVARWLAGHDVPALSCTWLTTPVSASNLEWVMAIAGAYCRYADVPSASGTPSTLRR